MGKTGRPKGSKDRQPRHTAASKQVRTAKLGGIMPLDVMLAAMRHAWAAALKEEDELKRLELMRVAHGLAAAAAPYCHPKLASVQHQGGGSPIPYVIYGEREAGSTKEWLERQALPVVAQINVGFVLDEPSEGEGDV